MTVLHWSRISDHIGRKPVIMLGLTGLSLSMYCFGLSRTFWGLVVRYIGHLSCRFVLLADLSKQSQSQWCSEWQHRRDEEHAGRDHRPEQYRSGIRFHAYRVVYWRYAGVCDPGRSSLSTFEANLTIQSHHRRLFVPSRRALPLHLW